MSYESGEISAAPSKVKICSQKLIEKLTFFDFFFQLPPPTITDWMMMKNLLLNLYQSSYYSETFFKESIIFVELFQTEL